MRKKTLKKRRHAPLTKKQIRIVIISASSALVITFAIFLYFITHTGFDFDKYYPQSTKILELVNEERTAMGLTPLVLDKDLCEVAKAKAEDMMINNYFDHTSPTYGSPFEMMTQFGITYSAAGENIAAGYGSAESVMIGWMNSPGHRANILNGNYTQLGVGYVVSSGGTSYVTYWVQEFVKPAAGKGGGTFYKIN